MCSFDVECNGATNSYTAFRLRLIGGIYCELHPVGMPNYRRTWVPGGVYFFTVRVCRSSGVDLVEHVASLRAAFASTRTLRPFEVQAIVVLPDHLHCIWQLPHSDGDNAIRWRQIKSGFSRAIAPREERNMSRWRRGERGIWQRRYWERLLLDERDWQAHVDYIHYNPVKHGHAQQVRDWPHSSFHRYVRQGMLPGDWGRVEGACSSVAGGV